MMLLTLAFGAVQAAERTSQSFPAAAENQKTEATTVAATTTVPESSATTTASMPVVTTENPFNKQDDEEVPYDRKSWIQPKEWNSPRIDPKNYDGGIMLYFDKIGLEPELSKGVTQRVYCSIAGVKEPVSSMKFHIFYDTRLKLKKNEKGEVLNPGRAVGGFTTGSAMVEEGQLVFYAYSPNDIEMDKGSLFTLDFIVPENAEPGEVYPIGISYVDDGIAYDTFLNSAQDDAGKLQMAYVFTRGIYNGYIKMIGEKKTTTTTTGTTTAAAEDPLPGDVNCDGEISIADAVLLCRLTAEEPCDDLTLTEQSFIAADYNLDDLITMLDAAELLADLQANSAE